MEYDPENDRQLDRSSFIKVEDENNLVNIKLKATLEQPELPQELENEEEKKAAQQNQPPVGLFKSILGGIKSVA